MAAESVHPPGVLDPAWNGTEDQLDAFLSPNSTTNSSDAFSFEFPLPRFTDVTMAKIIIVAVTFVLSTVGNVTFLIMSCCLRRNRRSRPLQSLLVHLAIADLIVTFVTMPSLGIWFYTVAWLAGNGMCKLVKSLQVLGLYLSTYLTVCISIDRCISVVKPMSRNTAQRRWTMVAVSWILSILFSIPQAVIFHVESPVPDFQQCVTFGFYTAKWQEQLYNGLVLVIMYPIPLLIILSCGVLIFIRLKKEGQDKGTFQTTNPTRQRHLLKARNNTLRTTAGIMASFIFCWTPYFVTMVWILFFNWQIVSPVVFDVLFLFGIFNSCLNPVVYGLSMFKKTTHRPTLSLIEFSKQFLDTTSERRSASMYSRISRTCSHASLSTRRSWQSPGESTRPDAPFSQHGSPLTGFPCRYGASCRVRRRSQQKYLHPDAPTFTSSTMSPKKTTWSENKTQLKRPPLTRADSSPSVLSSTEKIKRPNRRQSAALTVPVLPRICLTPPPETRNTTEFFSAALCLLHDEHAPTSTRPAVADFPFVENQDVQHNLSRPPSEAAITSTPDSPGSWEVTSCQCVRKSSACRCDSSPPGLSSASCQGTGRAEAVTNRPQVNARHSFCSENTDLRLSPPIPEKHHAERVQNMESDTQETSGNENDTSLASGNPLPGVSFDMTCAQTACRVTGGGASILYTGSSSQSVFDSPLSTPTSPVISADFSHRLSLCSFRERRMSADPYSALRGKQCSAENLKQLSRRRRANQRVPAKTVRFSDELTVSGSSLSSSAGSTSSRTDSHLEHRRARNTSERRASLADIKPGNGCRLKRKTSSMLP
ncbi:uncharacterized protein LOC144928090 [Branchiostoma floridae x Branchiostoma belcheri]